MTIKLSHSASTTYQTCPMKWKLRYKDRLYSTKTSGALIFGTALDKAVEVLLKERDYDKSLLQLNASWYSQEIAGKEEILRTSTKIVYATSDLDTDLLSHDDLEDLYLSVYPDGEDDVVSIIEILKSVVKQRAVIGFDMLTKDRKALLNHACWLCLLNKGELMLKAFNDKVLPQIEEVLAVQEKIELSNPEGDEIVGYTDFVVKWKGIDTPVIFDLKTSSREYEMDAVVKSPQLTLYTHCLGKKYDTRKAGFIVLNKQVRKNKTKVCSVCKFDGSGTSFKTCNNTIDGDRCNGAWVETIDPSIYVQILIADIPEKMEQLVIENLDSINKSIKNDIFTRSLDNCIQGFGPCEFYDVCHKDNYDSVVKVERKEK